MEKVKLLVIDDNKELIKLMKEYFNTTSSTEIPQTLGEGGGDGTKQ